MHHCPGFCLHGVSKSFGNHVALSGIELDILPGEVVALVGPSGAGKTTILRILSTHLRADEGKIGINRRHLVDLSPRRLRELRRSIGFVHQDLRLVPSLRVVQNVLLGRLGARGFFSSLRSQILPSEAEIREVHALLDRVGIPEKLFQRTDKLSRGQQQRVAIARALFQEPIALMADEPVSSLDPTRARDIMRLLTEIARERDLTLVLSMHDLDLAREFCPRLVGLRAGRIRFDRKGEEVREEDLESLFDLSEEEILADGA